MFWSGCRPSNDTPPDETILNKRYRKAGRRKIAHGGHTAHPAAHNDHVELLASHIYSHFRYSLRTAVYGCGSTIYNDSLPSDHKRPVSGLNDGGLSSTVDCAIFVPSPPSVSGWWSNKGWRIVGSAWSLQMRFAVL